MALLDDRRVLITGASAGLGFGIASELAARGARTLIVSRSEGNIRDASKRIMERLKTTGPAAGVSAWNAPIPLAADITHPDAAAVLAAAAGDRLGGLDVLVCNAGGPPPGDFSELNDWHWEEAFRLILLAPVRLIRACLPLLRAGGSGRIILISSISGLRPIPRLLLSNTLRPGLMGLARHLGSELAPDGILINAIAPGFFETERSREVQEAIAGSTGRSVEDVQEELTARIPLRRQGDPAELGRYIAFLVSEENTYITGHTLLIDGGLFNAP